MPEEGVAGGVGISVVGALIDGELQRVGAGTANSVHVVVHIGSTAGVRGAVPSRAVADSFLEHMMCTEVERQMKRHHTVATFAVGERVGGSVGRIMIGYAVPKEAVAGSNGMGASGAMPYGQQQGVNTGTALGIIITVGIHARSCVSGSVPRVAVAGGNGIGVVSGGVDGQIECVHIRTTGTRQGVVVGVNARGGIFCTVPTVLVAGSDNVGSVIVDADIQMQGIGAGTAVSIEVIIGVCARYVILHIMPHVVFTRVLMICVIGGMIDYQFKGVDAGAIVSIGIGVGVGTRNGIFHFVPNEAITGCIFITVVAAVVDGER